MHWFTLRKHPDRKRVWEFPQNGTHRGSTMIANWPLQNDDGVEWVVFGNTFPINGRKYNVCNPYAPCTYSFIYFFTKAYTWHHCGYNVLSLPMGLKTRAIIEGDRLKLLGHSKGTFSCMARSVFVTWPKGIKPKGISGLLSHGLEIARTCSRAWLVHTRVVDITEWRHFHWTPL